MKTGKRIPISDRLELKEKNYLINLHMELFKNKIMKHHDPPEPGTPYPKIVYTPQTGNIFVYEY